MHAHAHAHARMHGCTFGVWQFGKQTQPRDGEEDETDALDRAIAKLTRVMRYVGEGLNNTGQGMLAETMKKEKMDHNTMAYLQQYVAPGAEDIEEEDEGEVSNDDNNHDDDEQGFEANIVSTVDDGRRTSVVSDCHSSVSAGDQTQRIAGTKPISKHMPSERRRLSTTSDKSVRVELFGLNSVPRADREKLDSWDFNVLDYEPSQLFPLIVSMFDSLDLIERYKLEPSRFNSFLATVCSGYHATNSYHNFHHAADVTHVMYSAAGLGNGMCWHWVALGGCRRQVSDADDDK